MTMQRLPLLAIATLVAASAAGCSTPPDHFHTLRPAAAPEIGRAHV